MDDNFQSEEFEFVAERGREGEREIEREGEGEGDLALQFGRNQRSV